MENEYNKRFKNKEMSNDDFDVNGLWDNIAEELDTPVGKAPVALWKKYGGAFLLLMLLAGLGYMFSDLGNTDNIGQNTQTTLEQNQKLEKRKATDNRDSTSKLNETNNTETKATINENKTTPFDKKDIISERRNSTKSINNNSKKNNNQTNTTASSNPKLDSKRPINKNSLKPQSKNHSTPSFIKKISLEKTSSTENTVKAEIVNSTPNAPVNEKQTEQNTNKNSSTPIFTVQEGKQKDTPQIIAHLKSNFKDLTKYTPAIEDSLLYTGIREIKKRTEVDKEAKFMFEGGIYGGINSTNFKFKSTGDDSLATQKNRSESSILGQTYGLNAGILYKGFRLNTGVEYQNIWTKFEQKLQTNTTTFQAQALTLVRIDSIGNTLSREMRDTVANTLTTRNVEHYNKYQLWSIPLEVGIYRARKKWSCGISAGTSFNFLINQSGKTLDTNGSIIDFEQASDKVLFQPFSMSLRANLFLAYHLNDKIRLSLTPKWSWTQHDVFNGILQSDIQQVSLAFGLRSIF